MPWAEVGFREHLPLLSTRYYSPLLISSHSPGRAHVLRTTHQVGFHEHYAWEERFNEGTPQPLDEANPTPNEGNPTPNEGGGSAGVSSCTRDDLPGGRRKRKADAEAPA